MFDSLSEKLNNAFRKFRNKGRLTEADVREGMREVKLALLEADVNFKVVRDFVKTVTERAVGGEVMESLLPGQQIIKIVHEELIRLMGEANSKLVISPKPPTVVLMVGLQGSGKTTHAAKLAGMYKRQGKRPLLVACDVYRPAAIDQLKVVGAQVDVPVFEMGQGDPVEIAKAGLEHAARHGHDMVFVDTAGRLQVDEVLMQELEDIKAATNPTEILLVIDAMIGQESVNVASAFNEKLDITGVILSKLDGDTRGGAALSVRYVTGNREVMDCDWFYVDIPPRREAHIVVSQDNLEGNKTEGARTQLKFQQPGLDGQTINQKTANKIRNTSFRTERFYFKIYPETTGLFTDSNTTVIEYTVSLNQIINYTL